MREVKDAYQKIKDAASQQSLLTFEDGDLRPDKGLLREVAGGRQ